MLALLTAVLVQDVDVDALVARSSRLAEIADPMERGTVEAQIQVDAIALVDADRLKTGEGFRKLSDLLSFSTNTFPVTQTKYETLLTSLALGDPEAKKSIALAWDFLMVGMGRERRIGAQKESWNGERWRVRPTAKSILLVYKGGHATGTSDNPEVKTIVDADQAVCQQDWSKMKAADFEKLAKEDTKRLKRIKDILKAGGVRTANDFDRAALVCQHGETFDDYALAHELSVCSMMLGQKSAAWLAGASYDRMLVNAGLPQRFATQYSINLGQTILTRVDTGGINDTERKAVVRVTLQEARDRKWK